MLNRSLLFLALTLQISLTSSNVNAANDLERWNSEVGRTVRQAQSDKLAQTTYREMSSKNVTVSQDMRTVYPQIETQAQVAGSRTRVVAEAVLEVDKDKVWRDWNKKLTKFGKGTAAGLAAGAIVQGIVDGVGWIIDEGGKVTKKPNPEDSPYNDPTKPYIYVLNYGAPTQYLSSVNEVCRAGQLRQNPDRTSYETCYVMGGTVGSIAGNTSGSNWGYVGNNPDYNPSAPPPENTVVSEEEKEKVLKDLLNDPKYADLARDMIGNTYSMGPENPEPDSDVVNDLKNKQKDVLKSDNPKGDGKTRTDPKIDTGTQGQADTTPKPDPNPNPNPNPDPNPNPNPNTGSTTTWEIPPFCVYAAIVCDWIEWTKEKPEEEEPEEEEDINDKGIFDRTFDLDFSLGGQCPPNLSWSMNNKYLSKTFEIDLSWACMFFTAIGYALLFLSNCIGIWVMYETVVRKELKW